MPCCRPHALEEMADVYQVKVQRDLLIGYSTAPFCVDRLVEFI